MHASGQGPPNMAIRNGHMMQKSSRCAGQWPVNCLTRRCLIPHGYQRTWLAPERCILAEKLPADKKSGNKGSRKTCLS